VKRYTLFVSLINESGNTVCRGIFAENDELKYIKDEEYNLTSDLEEGIKCLVLSNIDNGTTDPGTSGSIFIPKKIFDNCVVTMEIFDLEEQ
jgi:hypothetical protein